MLQEMKPIMVLRQNNLYYCVCLNCKNGSNAKKESWVTRWIERHDTSKCLDTWDEHKHLFVLDAGYTPDAPPGPRNTVSQNTLSETADDGEDDTEIIHSRRSSFAPKDEALIRTYRIIYQKYEDTLGKKSHIEFNARSYCIANRHHSVKMSCACYLHGNDAEYNAISTLVKEYEKVKDDFKEDYPHLVQEYFNRLLQRGGYDWE